MDHIWARIFIGVIIWAIAACSLINIEDTSAEQRVGIDEQDGRHARPGDTAQCQVGKLSERFDCYPEPGSNEAGCLSRGCCWGRLDEIPGERKLDIPYCYFPINYAGYYVENAEISDDRIDVMLVRRTPSGIDVDVPFVHAEILFYDQDTLRIRVLDPFHRRFIPPVPQIPFRTFSGDRQYVVGLDKSSGKLVVQRRGDSQTIIFQTDLSRLIFANQFLQLSTLMPSDTVYGLGEQWNPLRRSTNWTRHVFFNRDMAPIGTRNLYGTHPFYLGLEEDGKSHGVFLHNSNSMEVVLQPAPAATFRAIGGILDIFVFVGPTPAKVVQQYQNVVGFPAMPPYWGLGFHLCRFGYGTLNRTRFIMEKNIEAGIPLDTQWNDIDYMVRQNDFTYDDERFNGLPDFVNDLHAGGRHYVVIVDPAVSGSEPPGTYPPYDQGMEMDIFVKNMSGGVVYAKLFEHVILNRLQPYVENNNLLPPAIFGFRPHLSTQDILLQLHEDINQQVSAHSTRAIVTLDLKGAFDNVWNDKSSVFPDFSHPKAQEYWAQQFKNFHNVVPFDGAWIDMNEPSNFYNGHADGCPTADRLDHPPYVPGGEPLYTRTLCMSDRHHIAPHYFVHNIYSHFEAKATYKALASIRRKRPFIISRATSPGQAAWSGHWSGDIASSWEDMRLSIPNMLSFGMYGMPLVGADICGFNSNTTVELCARWQALGAFYPFSRNHNTDDGLDQDPYSMGPLVVDAARSTLLGRYTLLPYLYTLFYRSHTMGETVARPLFFEFPEDPNTYSIDEQFLWGPSLMFSPALYPNQTEVNVYIPAGVWYDVDRGTAYSATSGRYQAFPAPFNVVNTLIRGGSIVPGHKPALTTTESRQNPFVLLVAPDRKGTARGHLFWDDGDSINTIEDDKYNIYEFLLVKDLLIISRTKRGYADNVTLGRVRVFGVSTGPTTVSLEGRSVKFDYNETTEVLTLLDLDQPMDEDFRVTWT